MNRFKNILFVSDQPGTESKSLRNSLALANANNASLTVMDVIEPMVWSAENQARFGTDLSTILRDRRLDELAVMTNPHCNDQLMIRTNVAIGTPFLEIIRAVLRNRFDLVIKSAEKTQGALSTALGPNDQHLVRKCPCPVWIDRDDTTHPYRRILAAVDPLGDEDKGLSRMILDLAFSIEPEAEVHIVHGWRMPGENSLRSGRARLSYVKLELLLEDEQNMHADALSGLLAHYGRTISDDHVHFEKSEATPLIARLAKELPADLVVTGTVGRTGIPGFFIGNTAESLMQVLSLPVLAVKPAGFVSPVTLP
jgi:nucleotide-binding universal stress UspA family protein